MRRETSWTTHIEVVKKNYKSTKRKLETYAQVVKGKKMTKEVCLEVKTRNVIQEAKVRQNPNDEVGTLVRATKAEMLTLVNEYNLTAPHGATKTDLHNLILDPLLDNDAITPESHEHYLIADMNVLAAMKLKLELTNAERERLKEEAALQRELLQLQKRTSCPTTFHLTGRVAVTLSTIASEIDYQVLKQAVLDAYLLSTETYRHLVNLILVQEFLRRVPNSIRLYLADKEENDFTRCAQLADAYSLIHRVPSDTLSSKLTWSSPTKMSTSNVNLLYCKYCRTYGHAIEKCPKNKGINETPKPKSTPPKPSKPVMNIHVNSNDLSLFNRHLYPGTVSARFGDSEERFKLKILRDTAALQSILLKSAVPNVTYTGETVLITDLTATTPYPLARVRLDCPFIQGVVQVAFREKPFPMSGVQLLLGNDLAEAQQPTNLIIVDKPQVCDSAVENPILQFVKEVPSTDNPDEISPVLVTTRAQAALLQPAAPSTTAVSQDSQNIPTNLTVLEFCKLPKEDPTLTSLFFQAETQSDSIPGFFVENQLLYRKYRPRKLNEDDDWATVNQLVVPISLRPNILHLAHGPLSHYGFNKTYHALRQDYYWPCVVRDVKTFVQDCHTCQTAGKPSMSIPKAPLIPIPVPLEPFSKLIIDCVGPLPRTSSGNVFIITVLCPTTRFPIAVPVKNITAATVVKQLLKIFTQSLPNESLGVSPYEMLNGRKCRTPLKAFKDSLCSNNFSDSLHVPQFLQNLRHTLEKSSPFQSKFSGPYCIKECRNNYNYVRETPDRRQKTQLCHINLLKRYKCTPPTVLVSLSTFKDPYFHSETFPAFPPECTDSESVPSNSEILTDLPRYFQDPHSAPLVKVFKKHLELLKDDPQEVTVVQHDIKLLPGTTPICQPFYRIRQQKKEAMLAEVRYLLDHGLATPCESPWVSPCILVPKPHSKVRLCTDFRKLNAVTIKDSYTLPRIDDILDAIGNATYLSQINLLKGYYQISLTEQRTVNIVIQGLDNTYAYLDDIVVATTSWDDHLLQLQRLFNNLLKAGLTINLGKSTFSKDVTKPYVLNVDASSTGIGGVLMQQRGEEVLPVSYYSYKLKPHQRNYSTIEKELLAILLSIQHYEPYLQGYRSLTIYSDHNPLRFLQQAQFSNQRLPC
ncbi:uncharacterized protein [Procambarus clarkii]|uniref:uncharacterized protein n=1 Tax=Procambarus clarkii TaxID=6728 RepID=UPI0037424644